MDKQEYDQLADDLKGLIHLGNSEVMRQLGDLYYQGPSGKEENAAAAFPYWKMAADHGDNEMAFKVGLCLSSGTGCNQDIALGFQYLKRSADVGNPEAQFRVGLCYLDGYGITADQDASIRYLRAAALQNHGQAQINLSRILVRIDGGFSEAVHWVCCAYLNGIEDAINGVRTLMEDPNNALAVQRRIKYIKANGVVPPAPSASYSSSESGGSEGCYIATAVYGSYDAPEVMILRAFRDNVLSRHCWGRMFIRVYYYVSPPLAEKLKGLQTVNRSVRYILNKFVKQLYSSDEQ